MVQKTTEESSLFERLFSDGRLGDSYERAKEIHDKFGDAGEYRESMETGVQMILISVSESGDQKAIMKALDVLEGVYEGEIKPIRDAGFNLPLSGAAFEMITFEAIQP